MSVANNTPAVDPSEVEFIGHSGEYPEAPAREREETEEFVDEDEHLLISKIRIEERREGARGILAITFTIATFLLFVFGFILAAISDGDKIDNLREVMITISGIFSGLLGFVIGYYFRKGEDN